jgi:hypothetical protein
MKKLITVSTIALLSTLSLTGCVSDADVASENLSKSAEQFEINRRIVFFNGITDKYLLQIEGFCSVETGNSMLSGSIDVTCKTGPKSYKKSFLGLSDNVSFFVEQMEAAEVSPYNYRVIFKPDAIIPNIDLVTQVGK